LQVYTTGVRNLGPIKLIYAVRYPYNCNPDNCHLLQLPPRTIATQDNCHLGPVPD